MTIDLNKNGKDDIEELLEDMHDKFEELGRSTEEKVKDSLADSVASIEDATGFDINGDGVVGAGKDEA